MDGWVRRMRHGYGAWWRPDGMESWGGRCLHGMYGMMRGWVGGRRHAVWVLRRCVSTGTPASMGCGTVACRGRCRIRDAYGTEFAAQTERKGADTYRLACKYPVYAWAAHVHAMSTACGANRSRDSELGGRPLAKGVTKGTGLRPRYDRDCGCASPAGALHEMHGSLT